MDKKQFVADMQERIEQIDAGEANCVMDLVACQIVDRLWSNELHFIDKLRSAGACDADFVPACSVMAKLIVDEYIRKNQETIVADLGAAIVSAHYMAEISGSDFNINSSIMIRSSIQNHVKKSMQQATAEQDVLFDYIKNTWLAAQQRLHDLKGETKN